MLKKWKMSKPDLKLLKLNKKDRGIQKKLQKLRSCKRLSKMSKPDLKLLKLNKKDRGILEKLQKLRGC